MPTDFVQGYRYAAVAHSVLRAGSAVGCGRSAMAMAPGFGFHRLFHDAVGYGRYRILPLLPASQLAIGPVETQELLLAIHILRTRCYRLRLVGGHARHDFIDVRRLSQ